MSIIWYNITYCLKIYIDRGFYEPYQQIQFLNATENPIPKSPNVNLVVLYNISLARLSRNTRPCWPTPCLPASSPRTCNPAPPWHRTPRRCCMLLCYFVCCIRYNDLNLHFDILFGFLQFFLLFFICFMTIGYLLRGPTPSLSNSLGAPLPLYPHTRLSTYPPISQPFLFSARQVSSGKESLEYFYYICVYL